jgi:hypothetical protein
LGKGKGKARTRGRMEGVPGPRSSMNNFADAWVMQETKRRRVGGVRREIW